MTSDDKTIKDFVFWLRKKFPRLHFKVKKSLKDLFPEPKKFKGFWKHPWAHADISVSAVLRILIPIIIVNFMNLVKNS